MKLKRKLYLFVEFYLTRLFSLFYFKPSNGIAIVRLDAIGDYILFRNFLYELKKSPHFAAFKITLIGNQAWKELAETLDNNVIDKFIWLDRSQIWDCKKYRVLKLINLAQVQYEYLVVPTYSRDFISDSLVRVMRAKYKIASSGDLANISLEDKQVMDTYYTQLLPAKAGLLFEFERNREFFQNLLGHQLTTQLRIQALPTQLHNKFSNYVVLFVGASSKERQWSNLNFGALAKWLHNAYGVNVLLCGVKTDMDYSDALEIVPYMHNLIGKTSLVEMVDILSEAKFVVSNETAIPHLCAALDVWVFVIYNGNYYGRFTPYPQDLTIKYKVIYHPEIEKNKGSYLARSNEPGYAAALDIDEITVAAVKQKILEPFSAPLRQLLIK